MANLIRIKTSLEVIQDVGGSAGAQEGISYINLQLDGNADSRVWGGNYGATHTEYDDSAVAYYNQVVCAKISGTKVAISNAAWAEGSPGVTDGTLPVTVEAIAVEYTAELGTVGNVFVEVSGEVIAELDLGESIVIPMSYGEAQADIYIYAGAYSSGVNEATVNVCVVGQNA